MTGEFILSIALKKRVCQCGKIINKGEKHIRFIYYPGTQFNITQNLCNKCLDNMHSDVKKRTPIKEHVTRWPNTLK